MSINTLGMNEVANHNKELSDMKNDTDDLTFSNRSRVSSKGAAYRAIRERKDELEIKALERQTDEDYFYDMIDSF